MRFFSLLLCACGASTPPPPAPTPFASSAPVIPPPVLDPIAPECTGSDIDLGTLKETCQSGPGSLPDAAQRASVELVGPKEAKAGAKIAFEVVITNNSDSVLTLRVLPLPWETTAKDSNGKSTSVPSNAHPCGTSAQLAQLSSGIANADTHAGEGKPSSIAIAPKGKAHRTIAWDANGMKWGPQKTASLGACTADKVPAPLAGGTYKVKVRIAAIGVSLPEPETSIAIVP